MCVNLKLNSHKNYILYVKNAHTLSHYSEFNEVNQLQKNKKKKEEKSHHFFFSDKLFYYHAKIRVVYRTN